MSLDTFRAMTCSKTMNLVAKPWIHNPTKKDHPAYGHVVRSIAGVLLAHDVQNGDIPAKLRRWLEFHVGFNDGKACKFRGYWDTTATLVDTGDPEVKCSVYYNPQRKNAVLWLLNTGKADKTLANFAFSSELIGREDCKKVFDAETGSPIKFAHAGEKSKVKNFTLPDGILVKSHEYRAIAVGVEE